MGQAFKNKSYEEKNAKLDALFSDKTAFEQVYNFYKNLSKNYAMTYLKDKAVDYNAMIKQEISLSTFEYCLESAKTWGYPESVRWFIEE